MIAEFVYSQPVKIWFGEGQFARLGEILGELGCRSCVIACGKHFAPEAEKPDLSLPIAIFIVVSSSFLYLVAAALRAAARRSSFVRPMAWRR